MGSKLLIAASIALAGCGETTEPEQPAPLLVDVTVAWRQTDCATLWTATSNQPLRLIEYDVGLYSNVSQRVNYYESGSFQGSVTEVLPRANEPIAAWDLRADGYHATDQEPPQGTCIPPEQR